MLRLKEREHTREGTMPEQSILERVEAACRTIWNTSVESPSSITFAPDARAEFEHELKACAKVPSSVSIAEIRNAFGSIRLLTHPLMPPGALIVGNLTQDEIDRDIAQFKEQIHASQE